MATSAVDICNLSLSLLSNGTITDIVNPSSENEKLCAKWYNVSLQQTLSLHPWNFAKAKFLAPRQVDPLFGFSHAFALPSDYLRLIFIGNTKQDFVSIYNDYEVVGNTIELNYDQDGSLPMQYTRNETRVGMFSPWFIDVLQYRLALNMSPELNRTSSEIEILNNQFLQSLSVAKQLEGQENLPITVTNSKYLTGQQSNIRINVDG